MDFADFACSSLQFRFAGQAESAVSFQSPCWNGGVEEHGGGLSQLGCWQQTAPSRYSEPGVLEPSDGYKPTFAEQRLQSSSIHFEQLWPSRAGTCCNISSWQCHWQLA
jgi:hypothetical protein